LQRNSQHNVDINSQNLVLEKNSAEKVCFKSSVHIFRLTRSLPHLTTLGILRTMEAEI